MVWLQFQYARMFHYWDKKSTLTDLSRNLRKLQREATQLKIEIRNPLSEEEISKHKKQLEIIQRQIRFCKSFRISDRPNNGKLPSGLTRALYDLYTTAIEQNKKNELKEFMAPDKIKENLSARIFNYFGDVERFNLPFSSEQLQGTRNDWWIHSQLQRFEKDLLKGFEPKNIETRKEELKESRLTRLTQKVLNMVNELTPQNRKD